MGKNKIIGSWWARLNDGFKHFLFVGLIWALVGGWTLTLIINTTLEMLLTAVLNAPPTKFYFGSLLLTATSISVIAACEVVGNQIFRRRLVPAGTEFASILLSTLFFTIVVLAFVVPELYQLIRHAANNTSYFYRHTAEFWMMVSLPAARLILLPALYLVIGRFTLPHGARAVKRAVKRAVTQPVKR